MHTTNYKGDLAVARIISDLVIKGFKVFKDVISDNLSFDLVVYKDYKFLRIQCKYSSKGLITNKVSWKNRTKNNTKYYNLTDFDYYAVYLAKIDKIIYAPIEFGGKKIKFTKPESNQEFYWYEDFLDLNNSEKTKKSYKDFGINSTDLESYKKMKFHNQKNSKVMWPENNIILETVNSMPITKAAKQLKVSYQTLKNKLNSIALLI